MKEREMQTTTRTAPARPTAVQARTRTTPNQARRAAIRTPEAGRAVARDFDYGPIPRAEMRRIVLEMIG